MAEGKAVSKKELLEKLRQLATKDPESLVAVQAEPDINLKLVVEVMDLARSAGIKHLASTSPGP
jgi:biopolymer transport protein ExbD